MRRDGSRATRARARGLPPSHRLRRPRRRWRPAGLPLACPLVPPFEYGAFRDGRCPFDLDSSSPLASPARVRAASRGFSSAGGYRFGRGLTHSGVSTPRQMGERIVMRRNPTLLRARGGETPALRERLRDESGIALVMALGIMLALTIALTSVVAFTSAAGRDAHRTTAGQKAYAVAEAGVNNALAVLYANYPSDPGSPGDPALLTPARTTPYEGGSCAAPVNNCAT